IDVMLVLLVIFMVTAPMITPGLIELPSMGQAAEVNATPLEVQIAEDGQVSVRLRQPGAQPEGIARDTLVQEVQARITADTPVVIAAVGGVHYEQVVHAVDELRARDMTGLGLLGNQNGGRAAAN